MQSSNDGEILSVTTTVNSLDAAQALARKLLDARLAACVQLDQGVHSLFHWKGQLCEEAEVRLVIKTVPGREAALQAAFAEHHPYELPQFLAVRMHASQGYGEWVRTEVAAPPV
jgi:periplasmic divalent cation tolerance protein